MKRKPLTHAARLLCALALSMSLAPAALAADPSEPTRLLSISYAVFCLKKKNK